MAKGGDWPRPRSLTRPPMSNSESSKTEKKEAAPQAVDKLPPDLQDMIRRAVAELPKQLPVEVNLTKKNDLPMFTSAGEVPEEYWLETPFTVVVSGHNFALSHFQINGRIVSIPTSRVLSFKNRPSSKRFGTQADVELSATFTTHDSRIRDLFLADDRMHSMFSTLDKDEKGLSEKLAYGKLVNKHMNANRGATQPQIRQMLQDRNLPLPTTLEEQRVLLAGYEADREIEQMRARGYWADAEKAKEQLMTPRT